MADEKTTLTFADEEEVDLDLFKKRKSIRLLPENAKFSLSDGGLLALVVTGESGEVESFERVVAVRSFPITEPDSFIAIREPDTKNKERGAEIGLIHAMSDFDEETQALLRAELDLRYFTPEIIKIRSLKEKLGYIYCDAETSAGKFSFEFRNPHSNVRILEDKRVLISDIDGNCFRISDPNKLDRHSYRKIEIYL